MDRQEKKVWVLGHKNPDTDSICAAIAYAELKNQISEETYEAKRAGQISEETRFVLEFFKIQAPSLVTDAGAQVKDINYRRTAPVSQNISLKRAWELMKTKNVVTLPVTNNKRKIVGMIVTSDIATSYMDVMDNHILANAKTPYKNIMDTLGGNLLSGNEHAYFMKGKVVVATSNAAWMEEYIEEDDLVIVGDRYESQVSALNMNSSCIVVCSGFTVSQEIVEQAEKQDCVIISTPFDTFTVARLLNQSMPIKYFMTKADIISFEESDYIDYVQEVMSKIRHRDFPIVDEDDNYVGMMSRRNLLNMQKKKIILVDHNEKSQAVDGIEGAEIIEIIDHHRIGSLQTMSPVYFRNQPLGCTSTIIYQMYQENKVKVTKQTAGLLCSAIISDTLMFRSPTCTPTDKTSAIELASIAGIDIECYAKDMFQAGSDLKNKSAEDICYQDFKTFHTDHANFAVAQISAMSKEELSYVKDKLLPFLTTALHDKKIDMLFVMLTDILDEATELVCIGNNADKIVERAFHANRMEHSFLLKGIVSRKKQLIPKLMSVLAE